MPEITIQAVAGRSLAAKHALMRAITEAVVMHFKVPAEAVVIQLNECPADHKSRAGVPYSQLPLISGGSSNA